MKSRRDHRSAARWLAACLAAFAAFGFGSVSVFAQLPQTRLSALFPNGAKAGETVEITLASGTDLDELDTMVFSHPGIQAKKKDGANQFVVTVAADVPPGIYETRVHGLFGTSNPRSFVVGVLPEVRETEGNNAREQANAIEIGSVVNGQANGGADVDFFKLTGKQGQRLLIECQALRVDSRFQGELRISNSAGKQMLRTAARSGRDDPMVDVTLPADGEYFLRVADVAYGGSAEHVYRLKIHAGPHIDFVVPPAGVPGTTSAFTLYGRNLPGGQPSNVVVDGSKLDALQVQIALPNTPDKLDVGNPRLSRESHIDGTSYTFSGPTGHSNPVTIAFAPRPVTLEVEPNNDAKSVQKISVPGEFAGAFQQKSDVDSFEFEVKAQQVFWIDIIAQRLGSLADPYFVIDRVVKNEKGEESLQRVGAQDDTPINAVDAKLFDVNHDDVTYRFAAPNDGSYRITIRDRYFETRGSADLQYLLAIREEIPDFRLVVIPDPPNQPAQRQQQGYQQWDLGLRRGSNQAVTVAAIRQYGFNGVIDVSAEGVPAGVTCKGASIGPNQNNVDLIFSVAEDAKPVTQPIRIVGTARIDSPPAVKAVTDAEGALTNATAQLPKLNEAFQKTVDPLNQAATARKQAEEKAAVDAANLKKAEEAKVAADKKLADAEAAAKAATEEKAKAEKTLADNKKAAETAAQEAQKAKQALDAKPDDQALKDALAAAEKKSAEAQTAVTTAQQALTTSDQKLTTANQAVNTAKTEQQNITVMFTTATQVAKQSDEARQKAVTAHDQAVAANQKADTEKKAGEAAVAKARETLAASKQARDAAARNVAHEARAATIVWGGNQQQPSQSRLTQQLVLSIIDEVAPIQITTDVFRENLNHGRQVLVPVKLAKRNGFDNQVQLAFQGVPQNLQVTNQNIEKGKDEALLRIFVPNNVNEGTYTLYLQATAQVPYLKNTIRLNRAKADVDAATAAVTAATEAAKKATADAENANKEATTTAEALKKAQADLEAAKKKLTEAQTAAQTAEQQAAAAEKAAQEADTKAKQAADAAAKAKEAAAKDTANQDLAKQAQAAEQEATNAANASKQAAEALVAAKKKHEDAKAAAKTATDGAAAAETAMNTAQQAATKAADAKKVADEAKAKADAAVKPATDRKTAADNELKAADQYSKSLNNGNPQIFPPSTPIVITVRKAPFTLAANVPNSGNLKRGDKLEIKVTVNRINGFAGPVKLTLPLPPGVAGLAAEPVVIPADKNEGAFLVTAAGEATEGQIANLVVRAEADWDGPASSDQPITINVQK